MTQINALFISRPGIDMHEFFLGFKDALKKASARHNDALGTTETSQVSVRLATSANDAIGMLQNGADIHLALGFEKMQKNSSDEATRRGSTALLEKIRESDWNIGFIFIEEDDSNIEPSSLGDGFLDVPYCRFLRQNMKTFKQIENTAVGLMAELQLGSRRKANGAPQATGPNAVTHVPDARVAYVELDFQIAAKLVRSTIVEFNGTTINRDDTIPNMEITDEDLASLNSFRRIFRYRGDDWREGYQETGRLLRRMLKRNKTLLIKLTKLRTELKDGDKIRFRIITDADNFKFPLEAVFDWDVHDEMREAYLFSSLPVYRVYPTGMDDDDQGNGFWYGDNNKLKCLLIYAPTAGIANFPDSMTGDYPELRSLGEAIEERKVLLDLSKSDGRLHFTEYDATLGGTTLKTLTDMLESQKWDIVHFIGHSWCERYDMDSDREIAYLLLPVENAIEKISVADIGGSMRNRARLFFANSCKSFSTGFIDRLSEKGIPAVIGYRWPVEDLGAYSFAELFYKNLNNLSEPPILEAAFRKARAKMLEKTRDDLKIAKDPTWAIATLLMHSNMRMDTSANDTGR